MDELYFVPGRPHLDSTSTLCVVGLYALIAGFLFCISRLERQPIFPPQMRH